MKSRFTPLVKLKKNKLDEYERLLASANAHMQLLKSELQNAYDNLTRIRPKSSGTVQELLGERKLLEIQREAIVLKKTEIAHEQNRVNELRYHLNNAVTEYEKFKYLESRDIAALMQKQKRSEQKELDESALKSFMYRRRNG